MTKRPTKVYRVDGLELDAPTTPRAPCIICGKWENVGGMKVLPSGRLTCLDLGDKSECRRRYEENRRLEAEFGPIDASEFSPGEDQRLAERHDQIQASPPVAKDRLKRGG